MTLAGKQFEFHKATIALDTINGKRVAVTIPAGDVVKVVADPRHGEDRVDILWAGRVVTMFAVDVEGHGTEVSGKISPDISLTDLARLVQLT